MMANRLNCNRDKLRNKIRLSKPALLSCLLIAALLLSCVSLARYIALSSERTSARVAKFSVSAVKMNGQEDIIPLDAMESNNGTYTFTVYNDSEVSVNYSIVIRDLPDGVDVAIDGERLNVENKTATTAAKELEISQTHTCTLSFTALESVAEGMYDISLQVLFEQID